MYLGSGPAWAKSRMPVNLEDQEYDDDGPWPVPDPTECYNCGCLGYCPDSERYPGEYICPNCGDSWDIYAPLPDDVP